MSAHDEIPGPFFIDHKNPQWRGVLDHCLSAVRAMAERGNVTVKLFDSIRTLDQNAKMWPMLTDFAKQIQWPINGFMTWIEPDDWKALMTAVFEHEARMCPGLRGGFVMLGARTSRYTRAKMADFITFLYAEGNDRGVKWSEKSKAHYERYGTAQRKAA